MHRIARLLAATLVLLALCRGARAQFIPAPNPPLPFPFPVGVGPVSIVAGNLNSDNVPDLAVLNQVDGTVTFILSNPPYAYTKAGPFAVGANPGSLLPSAMVMGDFNNDGNQDLAITNAGGNSVSILLGDGKGGIKATLGPFPVGKTPVSIAMGAFNGDSNLDLAVANRDSNNVTILRGDGTGNFAASSGTPIVAGNSPSSVAAGQFTGGGYLDLAVTNELDNTVTVLLGSAAGFQPTTDSPIPVGYNPSFVTVSDFNLDGNLDLAVANLTSNTVTVLLGNGTGAFTPAPSGPLTTGSAPVFIAVADFNGDFIPDLAIVNSGSSSNTVSVLLGNGTGGFKPCPGSPFAAGSDPRAVAVGDFNGNGPPDLAIVDDGSDTVTLLINTFTSTPVLLSAASFSPTPPIAPLSLVTIFGTALGPISSTGDPINSGTTVTLKDSSGVKNALTLTYVMPTQINALVPALVATGNATFTVNTAAGGLQSGAVTVASVAPSLFSANQSGKGVASGIFLPDLLSDNAKLTYTCPANPSPSMPCTPLSLDVSGGNSVLVLFGTGVRNRAKLSDVTVTVNGQSLPTFFAGDSGIAPGVDEVQVALPSTLVHSGIVFVTVSDGGTVSNQVTIWIL
jgi:uncharacterized protein (TIGR03437 family)